ncbi:lysophospholipid acyltransferase family protein [Tenuibacillus multivorans]|uniref:1-acyl-sn-glycerol-3-phosphate acyltransferase n=1 Tax=Tenuibacillus multivorans TaxID=237069 RepID=A0A1H0G100_9BACI|nr:lysophospholipid acyltransferase family protein [Tenuibacillus multivorans]GEL78127.1 1-acyl-sn-glycerol-3-phosphate acyltransferase [Tenuibacillus multivorans]SDO00542.1 1-acyl-sn-glycerol-3-phosphate acyltransferase [Tenuibacillus multivorans]
MRTIWSLIYGVIYVLYTVPFLKKARKLESTQLTRKEYNQKVHRIPKRFGRQFFKQSGSKMIIKGEANIPDGPYLIVGNHQSYYDIFAYLGYFKDPFGFISKIEVSKIPIVRPWMKVMDCLFLDREDRRQSVKTFKNGIQLLEGGHPIAIFPEGTRSLGREMLSFQSGSFNLARKAKVPVLPVMIDGTHKILEDNHNRIKKATVYMTICDPISVDEVEQMSLDELAEETQRRIQEALDDVKVR